MPYLEPDETDPLTLHGVEMETDDPESVRNMAECFIEEYARLGQSPEAIYQIFADGSFAGPALAFRTLGEDAIRGMILEQCQIRGLRRRVQVDQIPGGALSLPVLDA